MDEQALWCDEPAQRCDERALRCDERAQHVDERALRSDERAQHIDEQRFLIMSVHRGRMSDACGAMSTN